MPVPIHNDAVTGRKGASLAQVDTIEDKRRSSFDFVEKRRHGYGFRVLSEQHHIVMAGYLVLSQRGAGLLIGRKKTAFGKSGRTLSLASAR